MRGRLLRRSLTALVLGGALALAGCGTAPAPDPTTTAPTPGVVVPDTAPGRATQWVLDQVAAEEGPSEAEAAERFAPVFLAEVPAADVAGVFDQIRAAGPFTLTTYGESATNAESTLTGPDGERLIVSLSTDDAELIQGLFFSPAPPLPEIESTQDAADAVAGAGEATSFLLARVEDGTCDAVEALDADALRPIGSVFKLYVLGAVVEAVADERLTWDDTLTLTDDLRSLPSGTLQEEPTGTEISVLEAARGMIAISDNTATDLLIDAVGREAVEAAVERMGHSEPEVLRPLLSTREMFQLAMTTPELRQAWEDATGPDPLTPDPAVSARQRAVLEDLPGGELVVDPALAQEPVWPVGLDWFASAQDVCAAHAALQDLATTPAGEPVRDIMSANAGLTDPGWFDHVAFKGGSALGEIAGSWFVESGEGDYALVVQVASAGAPAPDGGWLVAVADQTLALLVE